MKTITYNPETHRLVPVDPTVAIRIAIYQSLKSGELSTAIYRAMLSAAPQPEPVEVEPVALPFAILSDELKDLRRFHECAMDGEGYDVPKDRMKRLAEIGLLHRVTANYYEYTIFGLSVLNGDFNTAPPDYEEIKRQRDELAKALESIIVAANDSDESCYGTLATRFVRGIAEPALASVKGESND